MSSESEEGTAPFLSKGLRYMIEGAFWFSFMSVGVKFAGRTVPVEQIVLARAAVALVLSFVWIKKLGISPWGNRRGLLIARGVLGTIGLVCFFWAVTEMPLADATVIFYTNPVFVGIWAALFLGERLHRIDVLGAIASLVGVALIARPTFLFGGESPLELTQVLVALTAAFVASMAYTLVRKLGETEEPIVVVFWFPLVATPILLPFAVATGYVPNWWELLILFGIGCATQVAQVRMTQGLKLETAARATSMTYLQVVFAFVWGVLLFGEVPTVFTVAGALVVMAAIFAISRYRHRNP